MGPGSTRQIHHLWVDALWSSNKWYESKLCTLQPVTKPYTLKIVFQKFYIFSCNFELIPLLNLFFPDMFVRWFIQMDICMDCTNGISWQMAWRSITVTLINISPNILSCTCNDASVDPYYYGSLMANILCCPVCFKHDGCESTCKHTHTHGQLRH